MKNLIYIILILSLFSCGKVSPKGDITSKDVKVEDFVNLNLEGNFRAFYVKSDSSFVNVETYKNVGDNLKIKVKDKTLSVSEGRKTEGVDFYNITIYSKYNVEQISMSSEIKTDNFKLNLKNNAKFIGSVNSRRAEIDMTQKSRANFLGKTKDAVLKISDTASIIAPYWTIENLNIDSKNGNYAELNVKDSLKGSIKNTAKLTYYNDPISAIKIDETATVQNKELD
ncbi:GIN domain-containing protein [Kaistella carnis]|uniref:GIN domain-containing protein n=1 Tax=Kaistella carnis TaxID=1241979 RepID=UPI0028B21FFE|nr:DUF2807 domain-containing protein [Kaistella carnis]